MENKLLQILLSNVHKGGSINSLIDSGLDFKNIARLTDQAIEDGLIDILEKDIRLSESGYLKLLELRKDRKNIPKDDWITSEEKSKIRKVTKDFIFLPRQDELP